MNPWKFWCYTFVLCIGMAASQFDSGMSGNRRVVVQLFEWPFNAVKEECKNFLGPQQFGAVLVSPVTENIVIRHQLDGKTIRPWYERYQPVSWDMITRSGTEQDFKDMVEECNKNDVRVYVDTVLNHGVSHAAGEPNGDVVGVGGTVANVKRKQYPGLGYDERNFHKSCYCDGSNRTAVRICEIWGLQDVNQTQPYVQDKIVKFMNKLIDYGVAGFRIDAAKHMWPDDLAQIFSQLKDVSLDGGKTRQRPFWALEVVDDGSYQEEYKDLGSEYDFSFSGMVATCFRWGSVRLAKIFEYAKNPTYISRTVQDLGVNQDSQRQVWQDGYSHSPDQRGIQQVMNAFILTFSRNTPNIFSGFSYKDTNEGPPVDRSENIMSPSQCTHPWTCEHRDKSIQWIIRHFTNVVKDAFIEKWWCEWDSEANQAAFQRGETGFAVFNADTKSLSQTFQVSLPQGRYCDLATGYFSSESKGCAGWLRREVEIKEDGSLSVSLPGIARSGEAQEPPYLVISVESRISEPESDEEDDDDWKKYIPPTKYLVWALLGVLGAGAVAGVGWLLCRRSNKGANPGGVDKAFEVQISCICGCCTDSTTVVGVIDRDFSKTFEHYGIGRRNEADSNIT
ncbi:unnamed protein product [Bemisia tabaci]|uniref:alpha-amylase n=1 Tax=Bemisia tabaci TaxID=7038 RepID=A0A9P0F611_BEMTA|nr:unnamed protein product [Bemisia tabaci]